MLGEEAKLQRIHLAIRDSVRYLDRFNSLALSRVDVEPDVHSTSNAQASAVPVAQLLPGLGRLIDDLRGVLDGYQQLEQARRAAGKEEAEIEVLELEDESLADYEEELRGWREDMRRVLVARNRLDSAHSRLVRAVDHKLSVLLAVEEIFEEFYRVCLEQYHDFAMVS